jgi:hypothetical protein
MCNRRSIAETIVGPATDALERSFKRRRTEKSLNNQSIMDSTLYLQDLYNDLVSAVDEEEFPSIAWNFDDSDTDDCTTITHDHLPLSTRSLLQCVKQQQSSQSLMRSKSFRANLSEMNQGLNNCQQNSLLDSRINPIRIVSDDDFNFFTNYSNGVATTPKNTTIKGATTLSKALLTTKVPNGDSPQEGLVGLDVL